MSAQELDGGRGAVDRLVREMAGVHTAEVVEACVRRCRERLLAAGADDAPERAEVMARGLLWHPSVLHRSDVPAARRAAEGSARWGSAPVR